MRVCHCLLASSVSRKPLSIHCLQASSGTPHGQRWSWAAMSDNLDRMPIEFRCKQCARLLRVPDDAAGRQSQCPECGAVSPVPAPSVGGPLPGEGPFGPRDRGPSGPGVPQWAPPSDSENPYQAPTQYGQAPEYPFAWGDAAAAAARVTGPAVALIVIGALEIATQVWAVFVSLMEIRAGGPLQVGPWANLASPEAIVIGGAIGVILGIVVIWGGVKMRNLESYPLAMAAAIIAMIPCFWPCCVLGLPFGIWALVVLSDPLVRAAVRR